MPMQYRHGFKIAVTECVVRFFVRFNDFVVHLSQLESGQPQLKAQRDVAEWACPGTGLGVDVHVINAHGRLQALCCIECYALRGCLSSDLCNFFQVECEKDPRGLP